MRSISKVSSLDELQESIRSHRPCLYTLSLEQQEQMKQVCSSSHLEQYGHHQVVVRHSPNRCYIDPGDSFWVWVHSLLSRSMSLADFLHHALPQGQIISGTDLYLYHKNKAVSPWEKTWEHLSSCVTDLIEEEQISTVGMWLSGQGVKSILHYDTSKDHNFNFQIYGQKQVLLFPPEDWKELNTFLAMGLHPLSVYDTLIESTSNSSQEALPTHPLSQTSPYLVQLNEGDLLLIPSQWYHYVVHQGEYNVNMTCWFKASPPIYKEVEIQDNSASLKQSSRDFRLSLYLIGSFIVATLLNLINHITSSQWGTRWCAKRYEKQREKTLKSL